MAAAKPKIAISQKILDINQCIFASGVALDEAWATRCLELSRAVERLNGLGPVQGLGLRLGLYIGRGLVVL